MRITRREFFKLFAEGVAALGILRVASLISPTGQTVIVRPPGAVDENWFNHLCVRCGICLEVCPTNAIVLVGLESGAGAVNTPKIDPLVGPCEFFRGRCDEVMQCSKFCPTGALQLVDKEEAKMGTVDFDPGRCLAYMAKECVVCYEMCPVPDAIALTSDLKPEFDGGRCVGCGICVHACPADPKALDLSAEGAKRAMWLR
ncbi:MAG: 4Fe-4S dicluster domain-containing protein [Nitrososphaeria archaeon]